MASERRTTTAWLTRPVAVALVSGAALAPLQAAKTDINVNADKTFSFAGQRSWAWHPLGAGDVKAGGQCRHRSEARGGAGRSGHRAGDRARDAGARLRQDRGQADLYVHYYVLATVGQSSQYMGQFVAPVPEWGLPPFAPVTTALEIYPVGTLIIDVTSPSRGAIVWRGSAERKINIERPDEERRAVLDRAVRDLIKRIPQPGK